MSALQPIRGRIIEVRRYINARIYWRRPPGPTDRYEIWVRQEDGHERKFTIQTQLMPARRTHTVTVIVRTRMHGSDVLGLFNASTLDAVNYMRTDSPPLLRVWEFVALSVAFLVMAARWGDAGMVLFAPMAAIYLLAALLTRAIKRALWSARVDRTIAEEAARYGTRLLP